MGKDLRGKEIGEGIYQQPNGTYCARFVDKFGKRKSKRSKKLQEVRQWIADATYIDEHSDIEQATNMLVDAWFDYWIDIKKKKDIGQVQYIKREYHFLICLSLPRKMMLLSITLVRNRLKVIWENLLKKRKHFRLMYKSVF